MTRPVAESVRFELFALLLLVCGVSLTLLVACSGADEVRSTELPETDVAASIDRIYKFDALESLNLTDRSELPIDPGAVTARWYMLGGWYVVAFDGLDLDETGPLCLGTSVLNPGANRLEHIFASATSEGACDDGGAGLFVPQAPGARGMRACDGLVFFVTDIPAELNGALFATITVFPGDGTGIELSGRAESVNGLPTEIDESMLSCAPLPAVRAIATPTPEPTPPATPAPASTGQVARDDRALAPAPTDPGECTPAETGELQDVFETSAAPYFVHHPAGDDPAVPTVIFLPGGSGRRGSAQGIWDKIFADSPEAQTFRIVIPYSFDADFIDEASRTTAIVNEVLWCYGGNPEDVHLAGTSNGGLAAFAVMTSHPELFSTLLGAPGAFPVQDPSEVESAVWAETLAGRAIFNGVGVHDEDWKPEVIATHNAMVQAGIESIFVEFPGQGHALISTIDESMFFEFWSSH